MTNVQIEAGTLTASRQDRIVSGLLLPYGEVGRTNLGRFSVPPGAITLPADPSVVTLNVEHDRRSPVGRATTLTATDAGVVASFRIAATPEGDAYLSEVESGRRRSLSAEVAGVVIRAGKAVSGKLFGAAGCAAGAFPSATLMASDVGEEDEHTESVTTEQITVDGTEYERTTTVTYDTQTTAVGTTEDTTEQPADAEQKEQDDVDDDKDLLTATQVARAPRSGAPRRAGAKLGPTGTELYASLAEAARTGSSSDLLAALNQVTQANVFDVVNVPQYIGELWNGVTYKQRYAPLLNHADLTSAKIIGWRFKKDKKPTVGDYAGNGAEVPTGPVETELVEETAARLAGGWAVDRIHRDFPNPEFWNAFFRAANEDYARKLDAKVLAFLTAAANHTTLSVDPAGAVAAGVSEAAYKIVKGGLQLVNTDRGTPDWAVLSADLYEEFAFTRHDEQLAYIAATFGLDSSSGFGAGSIQGSVSLPTGTALVGIKGTGTLHELGGASPLRVSAEDISHGNLEEALFGYYGLISHDSESLILVQDEAE
ncbi:hypothetical protein [Cellulomonas sp. NPDC089187]|uniref:hypothetical protein n=1 Tax=Cellulomonas sp. NPDC089187 TaxID=3154970 RepID=UPI003447A2F1